jgi:putative ABC transport system permease protein
MKRIRSLFQRAVMERQLDRELRFHFESQVRDYLAGGMSEADARRRARLEFGALEQIKDECRDERPFAKLDDFRQDLRYALRALKSSPAFAAACILTLALAIGANTAVFSTLDALIFRSLPYADSDRIAVLWTDDPKRGVHTEGVSYPNFEDWRKLNRVFDSMAVFGRTDRWQVTLTGGDSPERVQIATVTTDFFRLMGVPPLRGRIFTEQEEAQAQPVVLISERVWTNRFGRAENALGGTIDVNGAPVTIVGILPQEFRFPYWNTDLWFPIDGPDAAKPNQLAAAARRRAARYSDLYGVMARLKPGVTFSQAKADMARAGRLLEKAHPNAPRDFAGFGVTVFPLFDQLYGTALRPALWIVFGAVLAVLLIGATTVGSLLLTRAEMRRQEFAIRDALGASGSRLTRQLLTESGLLAALAAITGLVVASGGLRLLISAGATYVPRLEQASLRPAALIFTMAAAVLTALICGSAPIWRLKRESGAALQGHRESADGRTRRAMNTMVVTQVALAMMLSTAACLLLRSFLNVAALPLGYRAEQLLVFDLVNRTYGFSTAAERSTHAHRVSREVMDRIRTLPGVVAVTAAGDLFYEQNPDSSVIVDGVERSDVPLTSAAVSADYFRVMGVRLLRGRFVTPEEERDPLQAAVIVNEYFAKHFWPGQDPIGKTFGRDRRLRTVVGVVENMRLQSREKEPVAQFFLPSAFWTTPAVIVRATGDLNRLGAAIRGEVRAIDPEALIRKMTTAESHLDSIQAPRNFQTALTGLFSLFATGLAIFGSYSVLQYATSSRSKEFGIRLAMGATPADIARSVVGQGLWLAGIGIAAGLLASLWLMQLISGALYGVSAFDGTSFATAASVLALALGAAALAPAWRSSRANPVDSLRHE